MIIDMAQKRYYLKKHTILDDRYEIGEVLGEGGFGITYEAENKLIGLKAAVKEFYSRELMDRDSSVSDSFTLADPDKEERFQKEKERFLKEARILGDFSSEEGIVHVVDYFEANNTAYIVMEYISGITLKEQIRRHGIMPADALFQRVKPLLRTLGKIHSAGLVHRDISPDNIMVLEDGSFCLIDFGAATHYVGGEKTVSTIYKTGYAAPEQYAGADKVAPSSDLYALSAALYYCLTGMEPEDSLQRMLVDELIPADQLCKGLPGQGSDILSKGLRLKQEERWQNTEEMLKAIEEVWPKEEVLEAKRRRKRITISVIASVLAVLIGCGLLYYFTHETELRFRRIETETVWLTPEEGASFEDYRSSAELVKNRLEVFAGRRNYLWDETKEGIRFEVPVSIFGEKDPGDACRGYLTRGTDAFLIDPAVIETGKNEELRGKAVHIDRGSFSEINIGQEQEKYLKITLTEEKATEINKAFPGLLEEAERSVLLYFDLDDTELSYYFNHSCRSLGDGRSFVTEDSDQTGNYLETLYYDLTHEAGIQIFGVTAPDIIKWEDPETSITPGNFQTVPDKNEENYVIYKYAFSDVSEEERGEWLHNLISFKERMDVLEKPYAFGLTEYDDNAFFIRTAKDALSKEELSILGVADCDLGIGTKWSPTEILSFYYTDQMEINETENGLTVTLVLEDREQEQIQTKLAALEETGIRDFYLTCDSADYNYPVATIRADELKAAAKEGRITFHKLLFGGDKVFAEFLKKCGSETFTKYSAALETAILYTSENERPVDLMNADLSLVLEPVYTDEEIGTGQMKEMAVNAGGEWKSTISPCYGLFAQADFPETDRDQLAETAISFLEQFYETFRGSFTDGMINETKFQFAFNEKNTAEPGYLNLVIQKDVVAHRMVLSTNMQINGQEEDLKKTINERLLSSTVLKELLEPDETGSVIE